MHSPRQILILIAVVCLAGATFLIGIDWGLPSRWGDSYLFGGRVPWTGAQIMQLAGPWDTAGSRGADIAMHPLSSGNQPVVLNDTDAKRAEIVRRYRLYSCQPDEMITFRSLSRMKPAKLDFDPALYQYGGLWIYPIGLLLKAGSMLGLISLRTDLAYYLDQPQAFARFYLTARLYSAAWGLAGLMSVYTLARQVTGNFVAAVTASAMFASMPLVIDLAHEAKPHLAGTVLTVLTISAGLRYARTGQSRWWIAAAVSAGGSMGMVLTGYIAFAVLPAMTLSRNLTWNARARITSLAVLIGMTTFAITNPYLPLDLLFHRKVLDSNVGNYGTFYRPGISLAGTLVAIRGLWDGMSPVIFLLGAAAVASAVRTRRWSPAKIIFTAAVLPGIAQFFLLGEGKTAEYARFALTLDVLLAIAAAWFLGRLPLSQRERAMAMTLAVAGTIYFGVRYDVNFFADSRSQSTRLAAAESLARQYAGSETIDVFAEPAPYCLPPMNLFDKTIQLEPRGTPQPQLARGAVAVRAVDESNTFDPLAPRRVASPISWANKPFEIWGAAEGGPNAQQKR